VSDPTQAAPSARRLDDILFLACALAWAASLIHFAAAIEHVEEFVLFSVFFALLASAQLAWGILLYRSPTRRVLVAGAAMSLTVVALWLVSRSVGLPIGPAAGAPEPVGTLDSIVTADELVIALLMGFRLQPMRAGLLASCFRQLTTAAGLGLLLLSSLVLMLAGDPGHPH
jgi:hypothetical protein